VPFSKISELVKPINYTYDGSLSGFFCCVYESVYEKEFPLEINSEFRAALTFFNEKYIETDSGKAEKVRNSIVEKIEPDALALIECVFLSCLPEKEIAMLKFLLTAYDNGKKTLKMLGHPDVAPLLAAQKHFWGERHLLFGFVRFSDYGGRLVAEITPKNFVLPYLAEHFTGRFPNEEFMIYDKTHSAALVYQNKKVSLIRIQAAEFNEISEEEEKYRSLWKKFYDTIAIKESENPKCRMTHMPKRYWENMLEVRDLL
jgi:probable DNA metabolism protein